MNQIMSLTAIIFLIVLGILLFLVEFLIVPGVTISGIGGAVLLIVAVYFSYKTHGPATGHLVLAGTSVVSFLSIFLALRSKTWNRIMLNDEIGSRSGENADVRIKIGDKGETITRLNPYGKVMINDEVLEGKSYSNIIAPNVPVQVVKTEGTHVIVKQINN